MNGDPRQQTVIQTLVHQAILRASRNCMSLANWPIAERPRERLLAHGPAALSDAELLALFLGNGVRGKSALDVARELLACFGRVSRVLSAPHGELRAVPGVGAAKSAQIA